MDWDHGLDEGGAAYRIASTNASPLRVLAGPGTGKTFALMRRLARLLQSGVSPERILICTFARTAANDLKRSVQELGVDGADNVWSGTIHSFCLKTLSQAAVFQLTGRHPRPLFKFEERFLLEDLKGGDFGGVRECERRLEAFNAAWARLQTDDPGWPGDPIDVSFDQALKAWLRFHKAMLIGEAVPEALKYLRDNPACQERAAYDHILVDEYQDLNKAEQELVRLLASQGNIMIIGDEDQSIYSFKHAHPEGITTFHTTYADTVDDTLQTCRRCGHDIVALANHLIANNPGRAPRELQPFDDNPPGEVHIVQWHSAQGEAEGVARLIRNKIQAGEVEPGKVLVLVQRRQFGYAIRDALNALGTPAHSFFQEQILDGNPKQLNDSQAQQALCLLALLVNSGDVVALRCWCGFGSASLRKNAWNRLRSHCREEEVTPWQALMQVDQGLVNVPHTADLVQRFQALQTLLEQLAGLTGQNLINALFPADQEWATQLREAATALVAEDAGPAELLSQLKAHISQPELPTDVDYVRVMSLHKSKGLTADMVVVAGCIEGVLPLIDHTLPEEQRARSLEEQRRLFYVAITRAKRILVMSSITRLPVNDAYMMNLPFANRNRTTAYTIASQFLAELGPARPDPVYGPTLLQTVGA